MNYVQGGHGGLYKAPTKEERSERLTGKTGKGAKIKFIDLRFEREQILGFEKRRTRQDLP